jgi:hypothetical protein
MFKLRTSEIKSTFLFRREMICETSCVRMSQIEWVSGTSWEDISRNKCVSADPTGHSVFSLDCGFEPRWKRLCRYRPSDWPIPCPKSPTKTSERIHRFRNLFWFGTGQTASFLEFEVRWCRVNCEALLPWCLSSDSVFQNSPVRRGMGTAQFVPLYCCVAVQSRIQV